MRNLVWLVAATNVLVLGARPATAGKLSNDFKSVFEPTFKQGKTFAVVVQPGVPTTSVYGVDGKSANAHFSVDVIDGKWKASTGFMDGNQVAADYLAMGEVMELSNVSYKDNRLDMRFASLEAKKVTRAIGFGKQEKREPVATNFKFFFPVPKTQTMTAADVPAAIEYIGSFLKSFADEAAARAYSARLLAGAPDPASPRAADGKAAASRPVTKEIEVGMTTAQVSGILGKPQKEVKFQKITRWTYPDLTVIFEDGKVTNVKF